MRSLWIAILMMTIGTGCTSDRLRRSTINQATTLSDLQYQQVLSNLAMFSQNPSALPWHINLRDGSAQVADLGSASIGGILTHTSQASPSLLGARTVVEQWGMTPVTDDTELRILRVAYRRALGYEEDLSNENNEPGNELANDLAHELKKQTPDFNEFQDQISRSFEDGKMRYRNQKLKDLGEIAGLTGRKLSIWSLFGDPKFAAGPLADIMFPYKYIIEGYDHIGEEVNKVGNSPTGLKEQTYYEFLLASMSVVNERIVLAEEEINDNKKGYKDRKIPVFDTYSVDTNLKNEYDQTVNLVTPFAAELRRQVKETQKDMLDIHGGWYHVGGKKDVPHDACYVGHYRDCYAWVCRDGLEDLTQFTIKILGFSSLLKDPTISSTPGPRFTPASGFPSL